MGKIGEIGMRHKILGKIWNVRYAPNLKDRGHCDPPDKKNKSIIIKQGLKGEELMEVLIHELLHSCWFKGFSEEVVTEMAEDISRAVWKEMKAKGYIND